MRVLDRRRFLYMAGLGGVGLSPGLGLAREFGRALRPRQVSSGISVSAARLPELEIAMKAGVADVSILKGSPTRVWTYTGSVLAGDPGSLASVPGSYLGPTMRVRSGQNVRIRVSNSLSEATTIHWHGLHVPAAMDGHPSDAIAPGGEFVYEFPVLNRAGTYWYHSHAFPNAGPQVYRGLAGLFVVGDDEEARLGLPDGEFDIPIVIQDRRFDRDNQLEYQPAGHMMNAMSGFLGDRILVNGRLNAKMSVATRAHRFRILNGSNARIYKLAWSDASPLVVIATDGGLLGAPVERDYVMLAPGERIEIISDFSARELGTRISLVSLAFDAPDGFGTPGEPLPNGAAFPILKLHVKRREVDNFSLPAKLSTLARFSLSEAVNSVAPRDVAISFGHGGWLLNNRSYEIDSVASDEVVGLGTLEAWQFSNTATAGPMMGRFAVGHPMHIHGVQFQVLDRRIAPEWAAEWEGVRAGYVDDGWKDTVLVMPGEQVRLLMRFDDYPGTFMYHCHILEHEDMGMMRNYAVR